MASPLNAKRKDNSMQRLKENTKQMNNIGLSPTLNVNNNIKAEYDMWSWIYQELANLRVEISRLGTLVRLNSRFSPDSLVAYHSHIWSFIIPISPIINNDRFDKIERLWLKCKTDIDAYFIRKSHTKNLKIPFDLIKKLDLLYRIALTVAQMAGLGIKITVENDMDQALEKAITGE